MDFTLLIIGADTNAYYMARCFHELTGKKAYSLAKNPIWFTSVSSIIIPKYNDKLREEKVFLEELDNFYKKHKNVEIIGTVDSVKKYISNASFMVFPIFEGSGMKVKTCQSIMYGKKIIATREAFEGYIIDKENMIICNTKDDFIDTINNNSFEKFYPSVRKIYEENYSTESAKRVLYSTIEELL